MSNNQRELIIKNLNHNDCGSIVFRARNKYGEVTSTCLLNVTSSSSKKKQTQNKKINAHKLLSSPSMRNKLNKVFFGKSGKVWLCIKISERWIRRDIEKNVKTEMKLWEIFVVLISSIGVDDFPY